MFPTIDKLNEFAEEAIKEDNLPDRVIMLLYWYQGRAKQDAALIEKLEDKIDKIISILEDEE